LDPGSQPVAGDEVAARDWVARRLVAFGEDLALLLLRFGFAVAQAETAARLVAGEIAEAGAERRRLAGALEAAKDAPAPPAMPSGGPLAILVSGLGLSAWIKDKDGRIEARTRFDHLTAAQALTCGEAMLGVEGASGPRPVFAPDGTTLDLGALENGVVFDRPALDGDMARLRRRDFRCLFLLRMERHVGSLARDGVALLRFDVAIPVDRRLVGVLRPRVPDPEPPPRPRVDRRV